jgi:hypothetical protein
VSHLLRRMSHQVPKLTTLITCVSGYLHPYLPRRNLRIVIHRWGSLWCAWRPTDSEFHRWPVDPTSGNVKLLLPPRQSRGNSHYGLGLADSDRHFISHGGDEGDYPGCCACAAREQARRRTGSRSRSRSCPSAPRVRPVFGLPHSPKKERPDTLRRGRWQRRRRRGGQRAQRPEFRRNGGVNTARNRPNRTSPKPSYSPMIFNVIKTVHSHNGTGAVFM